jgi:hypothetical protein
MFSIWGTAFEVALTSRAPVLELKLAFLKEKSKD